MLKMVFHATPNCFQAVDVCRSVSVCLQGPSGIYYGGFSLGLSGLPDITDFLTFVNQEKCTWNVPRTHVVGTFVRIIFVGSPVQRPPVQRWKGSYYIILLLYYKILFLSCRVIVSFVLGGVAQDLGIPKRRKQDSEWLITVDFENITGLSSRARFEVSGISFHFDP